MSDLVRTQVLYVAEVRKQSSLDGFWETLTAAQINGVEAVAMDMWIVRYDAKDLLVICHDCSQPIG